MLAVLKESRSAGMVPLMIVYYFLQKYYRRSYVELQRCDATSRSPVYAHFSESLTGVETIRAFGYQQRFAEKSDSQIDYNHRQAGSPYSSSFKFRVLHRPLESLGLGATDC